MAGRTEFPQLIVERRTLQKGRRNRYMVKTPCKTNHKQEGHGHGTVSMEKGGEWTPNQVPQTQRT